MSRVAFLLGNLTDGGSETKTVRMANRLAQRGEEAHVIYLGAPHTLRDRIESTVSVEFLDRRGKFSIRALRRLNDYLRDHQIDVVFCVNHYPLIYGWPVCRFGSPRRYCVAAMTTYELTSLRDRLYMLLYAFILRRCDRVVLGSRAQQELWTKQYRLDDSDCEFIYNGVDVDHFDRATVDAEASRRTIGISGQSIVIGCVAHLRPEKSHRDLLAAFGEAATAAAEDVHLVLVGEGPEETRLRAFVDDRNLAGRVRFCGRANDVRPYLAAMDIFVLPSSSEVFSNAILEAMAMGLPVICSAVGGSVEMVVDGETGLTYPRHDVESLAEQLSALIADADRRRSLGEAGAARVREVFSIEAMDRKYLAVIDRATISRGHG